MKTPDNPFMLGEANPGKSAPCETVKHWIDEALRIDAQVTFAIEGEVVAPETDGTLACHPGYVRHLQ